MSQTEQNSELSSALNESARLLSQNRPGEAAAKLELLFKQHPDNENIAVNLSGAYILQRKWDKAVRVLKKCAQQNPDNAMLWANLGAAELGRIETAGPQQQRRAIDAYHKALRADPHAPNVHYHLGLIYKDQGDLMRAMAMFQRATEVNAEDTDAHYWLKRVIEAGKSDESPTIDGDDMPDEPISDDGHN